MRLPLTGFATSTVRLVGLMLVMSALSSCADAPNPLEPPLSPTLASVPALEGDVRPDTIINRYVVVLRSDVVSALEVSQALVGQVGGLRFYVYETALKGFAVANLPEGAVSILRQNPLVISAEEDKQMQPLQNVQQLVAPRDTGLYLLDRIDQRALPLSWQYTYTVTGSGVHIYIVDSGVRGGHQEWGYRRIGNSAAFIKWSINPSPTIDQLGHGTAVAGAAAGSRIGVAKHATIHSVRIDDGDEPAWESDIIAGLDWVAGHRIRPAVTNLSYEQNTSAIAAAITGVINQGVTFVTAAGNAGVDACNPSTQVASVLTVGATAVDDFRTPYSNIGPCVDLFAPGGSLGGYSNGYGLLELASNTGDGDYRYSRGTSFAAPVAAGVAALVLQQNSTLSPAAVVDLIVQSATPNAVINPGAGSPNRLLFSRFTVPPPPPSLNVSISGPTEIPPGATCTWTASVANGTPPFSYNWTIDGNFAGTAYSATGSKDPGNFSSSFLVRVSVTDSGGSSGERQITVNEVSGPLCPQ